MKPNKMILPMVCCIPLMNSCATDKPMEKPAWNIQPVYKVNNVAADNPNAMYQLGRYYQGQRRYALAEESYRKALAADDSFVEAHNGLGVIYSMQGKYDAAVAELKIAISLAPKSGHLYNNLGHTLYLQGAYADAVTALEQAASLDPGNARTLNNLGLAYAKAGEAAKSRQVFVEAAKPISANAIATAPETPPQANIVQTAQVESSASAVPVVATQTPAIPTPAAQEQVVQAPVIKESIIQAPAVQAHEPEVQTLALPKDRGVIIPATVAATPTSNAETSVATGQNTPNVAEQNVIVANVSEASKSVEPIPSAVNTQDVQTSTQVLSKATTEAIAAGPQSQPSSVLPVESAVSRIAAISQAFLHLEVANGNGTTGMARKVAAYLQEDGYGKARLTNRKPFTVQTTQIQYRSGHQADAEYLRANFPTPSEMVQSNSLRDDINLRVVLGKDLVQHTAYFNGITQKLAIMRNDLF